VEAPHFSPLVALAGLAFLALSGTACERTKPTADASQMPDVVASPANRPDVSKYSSECFASFLLEHDPKVALTRSLGWNELVQTEQTLKKVVVLTWWFTAKASDIERDIKARLSKEQGWKLHRDHDTSFSLVHGTGDRITFQKKTRFFLEPPPGGIKPTCLVVTIQPAK
jgi:hypothetical protein